MNSSLSEKAELESGMINGQALEDVSKLRYGLFPMSFNGCEVIAVCNALEYLGIKSPVENVLRYMQRYCVLLGLFGCNVYCVGRALKHFGADCMRIKSAEASKAFIISSWTGKPFLSSIHTVFCVNEGERIRVYNRYNTCPTEKYYDSVEKIFDNCRVLTIYKIK